MSDMQTTADIDSAGEPRLSWPARLADMIVIVVVIECVLTAMTRLLGVVDPITAVLLTLGWTSTAAQRIIAWLHGAAPRFQHGQFASELRARPVSVIVLGVTPWL